MSSRSLRADAQRNEETILEAAKTLFEAVGVDVPVRRIAEHAGVGIGTLYRRFPQRSDLVTAVFRREVHLCVDEAKTLAHTHDPMEALALWLQRCAAFFATKKGLSAALHSSDPAYETLPGYFREQFEPTLEAMLRRGVEIDAIRKDVTAWDLLRAIGNLSSARGPDAQAHITRMVDVLIDGMRRVDEASST